MLNFPRRSPTITTFLCKIIKNSYESHHITTSPTLFHCRHLSHSFPHNTTPWFSSTRLSRSGYSNELSPTQARFWASQPESTEHSTSDELTVQAILSNNWPILDENDSDWKSHATAVAQSIHLIKRRLQVI